MQKYLKKIDLIVLQKLAFAFLIFTIPSNLFKIFLENTAYVRGLRVDYLIPKINLSDLALILLFATLLWTKNNRANLKVTIKEIQNKIIWLVLLTGLTIFQLTTTHPVVGLLFLFRVIVLSICGILLLNQKDILKSQITLTTIKITLLFQSFLAWFQYLNQKSLLGYYFFGETNLNSYAGIAQSSLFGIEKILPYGTTAHPNVLGGILAVFSLVLFNLTLKNNKYKRIDIFIFLFGAVSILLTQSFSAILALILGIATIMLKNKYSFSLAKIAQIFIATNIIVISIFATLSSGTANILKNNTSISRRAYLNSAAINMTANNIFTGVGLQNFTSNVEKYSNEQEVVRFVQPAHNILLLFLSQTGLIGITILITLLIPIFRKNKKISHPEFLIALIPIMVLDHYLLTIQSGLLLLFFSLALTYQD